MDQMQCLEHEMYEKSAVSTRYRNIVWFLTLSL